MHTIVSIATQRKKSETTMYVTRLIPHCKRKAEFLSLVPEGPNSGYLVIQDEEADTYSCFQSSKNRYLQSPLFLRTRFLLCILEA